jgi:predicted glycoside hydrolase/deacetylase ChbG (UPF0249 family)
MHCKQLIVTADDFGMHAGINDGVISGWRRGVIGGASLMANGAAFEHACLLIRENPGLPVGVHATLTSGKPVMPADRVPSLVDDGGSFYGKWQFLKRLFLRRARPAEIELELRAQIEKIHQVGLLPDFLNSHHHIHVLQPVARLCAELAREFAIPCIRQILPALSSCKNLGGWQQNFLAWVQKSQRDGCMRSFGGMDLFLARDKKRCLKRYLAGLDSGIHELMCHPALSRGDARFRNRDKELEALCAPDIASFVSAQQILFTSFRLFRT